MTDLTDLTDLSAQVSSSSMALRLPVPTVSNFGGYVRETAKLPFLSKEEEIKLADKFNKKGCIRSGHMLVYAHLRQVVAIARVYNGYGLPQPDLVQEGNIGLMRAVTKFDLQRNVRLNVYSSYWIRSQINEYVIRNWRIVKVATTNAQRKLFFNLRRVTRNIGINGLGRAKIEGIAHDLRVASTDVVEMNQRMHSRDVPFDSNPNQDSDVIDYSPATTLAADNGMHAELIMMEESVRNNRREWLQGALRTLTERERFIVEARSLSESGKDMTLSDLGRQLGISSERVRQIESKALRKITDRVQSAYRSQQN